jgi:hypothetical protein
MKRISWAWLLLCTVPTVFGSGCLFVRHSTVAVREHEAVRPMQFESEQARNVFEGGVTEMKAHKDESNAQVRAVPFLFWYSRVEVPSDNAVYNDQARICDANGDDCITLEEAAAYRARVAEKAKVAETKTRQNDTASSRSPPGEATISLRQ